ncbi:MAG: type II toxin-antitoxin system HicB family antitoxin [Chloroflexi bacterium]|nr:type II toxin-antitoxin system HicB family antitoxin [Ktedonobacteraceae bacterium]MBV9706261.1 type II toxin-antitoxin system HicB family antitoxin [Chloroflexota bacterium]
MHRHLYDHYSMFIQWSQEDQAYLVNISELPGCRTHGDSHEEAVRNGLEAIQAWIEANEALGRPIPQPKVLIA